MELEPCLVRGLRLLHSQAPDSADQLRALLEDVLARATLRHSSSATATATTVSGKQSPANMSPRTASGSGSSRPELAPLPSHKRPYDKYKEDNWPADSSYKRLHLDATRSYPSSPARSRDSDSVSKRSDDSSDHSSELNGLAMDLMDQLACVVCRNIGVTSGNQLQECSACGSLYHQECHSPPIPSSQLTDARAIWLCSKCSGQSTSSAPATATSFSSATSTSNRAKLSSTSFSSASIKPDRVKPEISLHRRDVKSSTLLGSTSNAFPSASSSSASSSSTSLSRSGFASLSSSVGGSSSSSKSSSKSTGNLSSSTVGRSMFGGGGVGGGGGSGAPLPPPNSMVSAEKRMQMMKKKAAAKLNEKRKI